MMMALNDDILDSIIDEELDLLRVESSQRRLVRIRLRVLSNKLASTIKKVDPTEPARISYRIRRTIKLNKELREIIRDAYKQLANEAVNAAGQLATTTAAMTVKDINRAAGIDLIGRAVNDRVIRDIGRDAVVSGKPLRNWWRDQETSLFVSVQREIRDGVERGQTLSQIVQRIRGTRAGGFRDGIMRTTTNKAEALVRTTTADVSNRARIATFDNNADVIGAVEWVATLDSRTTKICMALDGLTWTVPGHKPIGHTTPFPGSIAHFGERSTQVPIIKPLTEIDNKRVKNEVNGLPPAQQASIDGALPNRTNFERWFKGKPAEFQDEQIGPSLGRAFRRGDLSLRDLIDGVQLRPLTLGELNVKRL